MLQRTMGIRENPESSPAPPVFPAFIFLKKTAKPGGGGFLINPDLEIRCARWVCASPRTHGESRGNECTVASPLFVPAGSQVRRRRHVALRVEIGGC